MSGESERPVDEDLDEGERKRLFERAVPELVKRVIERAVESSIEKLTEGPENLRSFMGEMKLPKEALQYIYSQIDDTKKGVYRVVAKEIRDVLENVSFADEIADVLTKLSFEINTQIRFVPNPAGKDDAEQGEDEGDEQTGGEKRPSKMPRAKVVSKVVMKARDALKSDRPPR